MSTMERTPATRDDRPAEPQASHDRIDVDMSTLAAQDAPDGPATPQALMRALEALSPAQHTLLREVARYTEPVTVTELAVGMGLHPNSVRESMAALLDAGLVARGRRPAVGRGRPSWTYRSVAPAQPSALAREFADVCAAVADHLADTVPDPEGAARDIGARWARRMVDVAGPPAGKNGQPLDEPQRIDVHGGRLRLLLSSLGYGALSEDTAGRLTLHQCPLRIEGQVPSPLVCQMHRGLIDEVLQRVSHGNVQAELTPFAGPDYCSVALHLTRRDAASA